MRLPWVSRARFEDCERVSYDRWNSLIQADSQRQSAQTEVRRLTDIIVSMKRDGFTAPVTEATVAFQQQSDDLPNPVLDALDEIGLTGAQLEQHKDWARRRLRREKNAEIVAEELLAGGLVMEEPEA